MILMIDVMKKDKSNYNHFHNILRILMFCQLFLSQQLNFLDNFGNSKAFDTVLT